MGRMLTFVAKLIKDTNNVNIRGVGVDGWTALLLNYTTGSFQLVGNDTAHVCGQSAESGTHSLTHSLSCLFTNSLELDMIVEPDVPLTFQNVTCIRLEPNSTYDMASDIGSNIVR